MATWTRQRVRIGLLATGAALLVVGVVLVAFNLSITGNVAVAEKSGLKNVNVTASASDAGMLLAGAIATLVGCVALVAGARLRRQRE